MVAFTGFLSVIFTILNVVNFCRAQMLISNAVDTAAKELAQYSYFYKMSGLQKFDKAVKENADIGAGNLNQVIGTVDGLYSSLGEATSNTVQNVTNLKNATDSGETLVNSVQHTLSNLSSDATQVEASMNTVMSAFEGVANDPILYIKSIVAVAGNDALDLLKSHVIAAPLAKMFTIKHFGDSRAEADAHLKNLGVVDGIDGMNFKMSTIFSSNEPENVHLAVYYKLKLPQIFGWIELEAPICKEAITHAWLGGDDVLVQVKPTLETALEETGNEEEEEEQDEGEEEESEGPDEPIEEAPEVDFTDSVWTLPERDGHYYNQLEGALLEKMKEKYHVRNEWVVQHYHGCNDQGVAYSMNYPISNSSQENSIVIDTFGGSGSTMMACEQTGRECRMMELDPKYASVILRRYVEDFGNTDQVYVERDGVRIGYANLVKEVEHE